MGLPIIESEEIASEVKEGDVLIVDIENGKVKNQTSGKTYKIGAYPEFMQKLIKSGGLMKYVKELKSL